MVTPNFTHAQPALQDLTALIDYLIDTEPDDWNLDVVRSADGDQNCFFGHLFNWAELIAADYGFDTDEQTRTGWCNAVWECFEEMWSTTYVIYPINDGSHPRYQQHSAQARVITYLQALQNKDELTTYESMEAEAALYDAETAG